MSDFRRRILAKTPSPLIPLPSKSIAPYYVDLPELKPDSEILASLQKLHAQCQSSSSSSSSKTLTRADLILHIPDIAKSILNDCGFSFDVPSSRSSSNEIYIKELDQIVLKYKGSARPKTLRKAAITAKVLSVLYANLLKNFHIDRRGLFCSDVELFQDQTQSDASLDDVSCMLGCNTSSLNIIESQNGRVTGRLVFTESGHMIDCTQMGSTSKLISSNIDRVGNLKSDALFILLIEKDAAYMRLAYDQFYNRFPCIIVNTMGQPDVSTRLFLRKIKMELKLPVLALVDIDPHGLKTLSFYMCGSKNMSYDSSSLTIPDIKWLGLRPSDLDKYQIPKECRQRMTDRDVKAVKGLLKEDFVKQKEGWVKELELMVKTREKAEIEALFSLGPMYLTEVYLPLKIQQEDWL